MFKYWRRSAIGALMLTASVGGQSALPASAVGKSQPLTRTAVIKLIKQYAKPGPRGETGPAGSYTIGPGSGLQQTGRALNIDGGIFAPVRAARL